EASCSDLLGQDARRLKPRRSAKDSVAPDHLCPQQLEQALSVRVQRSSLGTVFGISIKPQKVEEKTCATTDE
ncbi:hypothetical protein DNTS_002261, partial [Danionella cerebrum]